MKTSDLITETIVLDAKVQKNVKRAERVIRSDLKSFLRNMTLTVTPLTTHSASFKIEGQRVLREREHEDIETELKDAIQKSDEEGHIHTIGFGDESTSSMLPETILYSLRPGMKVNAEAFFPTIEYVVTWKRVITKK